MRIGPLANLSGFMLVCGLTACSAAEDYFSNINPFKKTEPPLPGERQAVLTADTALQTPDQRHARPISVPPAVAVNEWLNPGGPPSNSPGHAALQAGNGLAWSAQGEGGDAQTTAPPIVVNGKVVLYSGNRVTAYDLAGGGRLWATEVAPAGADAAVPGGGIASDGQRIYVATGLRVLAALNIGDGQPVWTQTLSEPARSAPTVAGGRVYVVSVGGVVSAFSTTDGKEAWRHAGARDPSGLLASSSPGVFRKLAIMPFSSGELAALDAATGEMRWSSALSRSSGVAGVSTLSDIAGRPVIDGGAVYAGSVAGRVVALRMNTGEKIWERNIATAFTPVVAGDGVFILNLNGEVYALDRNSGDVRWAVKLPETETRTMWAGPVLANQALWIVSNGGNLASLDARTGQLLGQQTLIEGSMLSPIAAAGRLIIATSSGGLVAIQ